MNLNGVTSAVSAYSTYSTKPAKTEAATDTTASAKTEDTGVIYEPSTIDREAVIAQLKADAEQRTSQMRSLVEELLSTQAGKASSLADLFRNLKPDAETIAQAQADIAEDGYWGVKQTSDRIFEFAKALSGGDQDKMEDMLEAFKKGFNQATKAWGETLPDICGQTYDAVLEKFEAYKNEAVEA